MYPQHSDTKGKINSSLVIVFDLFCLILSDLHFLEGLSCSYNNTPRETEEYGSQGEMSDVEVLGALTLFCDRPKFSVPPLIQAYYFISYDLTL